MTTDRHIVDLLREEMHAGFNRVEKRLEELSEKVDLTNGRVRHLELRNAWLSGGLAALAFLVGPGVLLFLVFAVDSRWP